MNPKIARLARQAKEFAIEQMGHEFVPTLFSAVVFQQKFAELIIAECANVAYSMMGNSPPAGAQTIGYEIEQHFKDQH